MSQQVAPSCFKMVRAFARGLRKEYMEAADQCVPLAALVALLSRLLQSTVSRLLCHTNAWV